MRIASHPRTEKPLRQTSLRLDEDIYDAIISAAKEHGITPAEEMRQRLFHSVLSAPLREADPQTRELLAAVQGMAADLEGWVGPWHSSAGPWQAFVTALAQWLRQREPEGEPVLNPTTAAREFFGRRPVTPASVATMLVALNSIPLGQEEPA